MAQEKKQPSVIFLNATVKSRYIKIYFRLFLNENISFHFNAKNGNLAVNKAKLFFFFADKNKVKKNLAD